MISFRRPLIQLMLSVSYPTDAIGQTSANSNYAIGKSSTDAVGQTTNSTDAIGQLPH
jgi:hypothetical protein